MHLTVFYDGLCPLCVAEMDTLRELDTQKNLTLVDLYSEGFEKRYPMICPQEANRILHGMDSDGRVLTGLDANVLAWQLVNRKPWLRMLRWPLVRVVADWMYLRFANNRYRISYWLTGQARCTDSQCNIVKEPKR